MEQWYFRVIVDGMVLLVAHCRILLGIAFSNGCFGICFGY